MLIVRTWHKLQIEYSTLEFWSCLLTTKETGQKIDNLHEAIILSKPLSPINQPKKRVISFAIWTDPTNQKYF